MMTKKFVWNRLLPGLLSCVLLLAGCRREEEMEKHVEATTIREFTANFDVGAALPGAPENMIYLTDRSGNVLAGSTWKGAGTVRLPLSTPQQSVNVTIVRRTSPGSVVITSYLDVKRASWTWKEATPSVNRLPGVRIDFENVPALQQPEPENSGEVLFSSSSYDFPASSYAAGARRLSIEVPSMPSAAGSALLVLPREGKYKFISTVRSDRSYRADLSEMGDLSTKNMSVAENQNYRGGSVSVSYALSYRGAASADKSGLLDFQLMQMPDAVPPAIPLQYANLSLFGEFYTTVYLVDRANNTWTQVTRGQALPDRFTRLNGDYRIISQHPESVQVQTTGEFDYLQLNWQGRTAGMGNVRWSVVIPSGLTTFNIARVPPAFSALVPGLSFDQLRLSGSFMVDYENIHSYDDYINLTADPANWSSVKVSHSRSLSKQF